MKMIDRFMDLISQCEKYKKIKSPITKWRILHRRFELKKILREKDEFSPEDLCSYGWILNYGKQKWGDKIFLDSLSISGVDGYYCFDIMLPNLHIILTAKALSLTNEISLLVYNKDGSSYSKDIKLLSSKSESELIYTKILKEELKYSLNCIIRNLVKGE